MPSAERKITFSARGRGGSWSWLKGFPSSSPHSPREARMAAAARAQREDNPSLLGFMISSMEVLLSRLAISRRRRDDPLTLMVSGREDVPVQLRVMIENHEFGKQAAPHPPACHPPLRELW